MKIAVLITTIVLASLAFLTIFLMLKKVIPDKEKFKLGNYLVFLVWSSFLFLVYFAVLNAILNIYWFLGIAFFLSFNVLLTWIMSGKKEEEEIEQLISERNQLALDLEARDQELISLKNKKD